MEYSCELQDLTKLRNQERSLLQLLEKIDKEIMQTDVEWLHMKNIAEVSNPTAVNSPLDKGAPRKSLDSKNGVLGNIKKEQHIDDAAINLVGLDLNPSHNASYNQGADEEFDSD